MHMWRGAGAAAHLQRGEARHLVGLFQHRHVGSIHGVGGHHGRRGGAARGRSPLRRLLLLQHGQQRLASVPRLLAGASLRLLWGGQRGWLLRRGHAGGRGGARGGSCAAELLLEGQLLLRGRRCRRRLRNGTCNAGRPKAEGCSGWENSGWEKLELALSGQLGCSAPSTALPPRIRCTQ